MVHNMYPWLLVSGSYMELAETIPKTVENATGMRVNRPIDGGQGHEYMGKK